VTGLLVDYGGVLTTSVFESFRAFCRAEGVEPDTIPHLLVEDEEALAELHAFEIGRLEEAEFERRFAGRLGVAPERLLERIFAALGPDERMIGAVRAVRAAGVPTALVSNSWGLAIYDRPLLAELFDAELISAEVGLRKPDPSIFLLAAERPVAGPGVAAGHRSIGDEGHQAVLRQCLSKRQIVFVRLAVAPAGRAVEGRPYQAGVDRRREIVEE